MSAAQIRDEIARISVQIHDLETAYFAGTAGVEDTIIPLGPYRVVNKKGALDVARDQRVFSLSASADGGSWPATAHAPHELAAALAAGGVTPRHVAHASAGSARSAGEAGASSEAAGESKKEEPRAR
jgi:hypothetical protein